ncbi:hypothetical protein QWJ34_12625 [Saccharibacillus sp. CPCC 101409]|uniref:hypothetical protein n=1 Tax=Saccharibacillus sp. CPCC 101409 TaxID=3058041 RepID=UPI0026725CDB|nr:hypothetical protein [Saccharibacillus sp. CPCC 101409]MDO3410608.1 hypothetical protein [Saccharibacillus sp. CPCC 101409]
MRTNAPRQQRSSTIGPFADRRLKRYKPPLIPFVSPDAEERLRHLGTIELSLRIVISSFVGICPHSSGEAKRLSTSFFKKTNPQSLRDAGRLRDNKEKAAFCRENRQYAQAARITEEERTKKWKKKTF